MPDRTNKCNQAAPSQTERLKKRGQDCPGEVVLRTKTLAKKKFAFFGEKGHQAAKQLEARKRGQSDSREKERRKVFGLVACATLGAKLFKAVCATIDKNE